MFNKKIVFTVLVAFLISSCADTWSSVKDGLTGAKRKSSDEFLVKKKDPLVLPPDFESLPSPSQRAEEVVDEITSFEKTLRKTSPDEEFSSSGSSEQSILEKIRKK
tara:strand:- start:548 stop:865 length:318 start_codon:yes stop_codon:yes gene_type:complete